MNRISAFSLVAFTLVACATTKSAPKMPEGYVATPNGLFHRSCVREIPKGYRISPDGVITSPDGKREVLAQCSHPRLDARTLKPITSDSSEVSGWVISSGWTSNVPVGALMDTVVVPPLPTAQGGLSYFFPGLTPASGGPIMQTVLAAHPEGFWTINAAYCCPAGWQFHGTPVPVNPGDVIGGFIGTVSCSSSSCDWNIATFDMTTDTVAGLIANNVTTPMVNTSGGVLEAYGVTSCDQYPANGTITFSNVTLVDQNGKPLQPAWTSTNWNQPLACGYAMSSTSPASVTLTY